MLNRLPFFKNKKEVILFGLILLSIFSINIFFQYYSYKDFKSEEIYTTKATVINIYNKQKYKILKLKTHNFIFFTSYSNNTMLNKLDTIQVTIVTTKITFLQYIKNFYAPTFNIHTINTKPTTKQNLMWYIQKQHSDINISSLFNALFLAIPINKHLQQIASSYGISHLLAISGFHIGVLSFILYWILYIFYTPLQKKYFPYRNKKYDILIIISIILLGYLIFLDLIPSLLRAYIMFIFGIYLLRNNIKLISFSTLLIIVSIIIAFFPSLIFSLSLWFSVAGVFYIFLFIKYFSKLNKIIQFFFFNFWIFLAINPIVHYYFPIASYYQIFSVPFTISFTIFYPMELFLHIINYGNLLDTILIKLFNQHLTIYIFNTSWYIFYSYLLVSFLAVFSKKWFIGLNIYLMIYFLCFLINS